ncbi:hypothetical protein FKP32DRAFT_1531249, partial [Trametes sanguinea]
MLSCTDLDRVCSTLTKAFGTITALFGGKSIILAGDFAQLQPPGRGHSLYSASVGTAVSSRTESGQRAAIGKSVWHSFTTVVLLRSNMRQRGMSPADVAFRTALSNLRYANCTDADIALLRTRVFSSQASSPVTNLDGFEDVSIITARNAHRDAINRDGAERYAQRTGKQLHYFYSHDSWGKTKDSASVRKAQKQYASISDPIRQGNAISQRLQRVLWSLRPAMTEHHPGVLALCEGMPVILKANEATEVGATNGAAGHVEGWQARSDASGREYLQVLFVRLDRPPRDFQLDGLPPNVVPITPMKRSVACTLPTDDIVLTIQREQVACLQNFAISDFTSQGLTRLKNVVHPRYCSNHQSLYTVLSRSSSLQDTVVLEGLDVSKMRCGPSPALLQEF